MFRRRSPDPAGAGPAPENPYLGLRKLALDAVQSGLATPGEDHPRVSGVVVDIPASGGFVTIVALTDNTTSMYTSVGGGTIGAGTHAEVAQATHGLLISAEAHLGAFDEHDDDELPQPGYVRFHILTPTGRRSREMEEDCFWGKAPHELMPVIAAAQGVIGALGNLPPS